MERTVRPRLVEKALNGDTGALSRCISLIEQGSVQAAKTIAGVQSRAGRAHIVGITGPPGVGKSTLVGAVIRGLRERDERVAVISVDPSSSFSGGALLGDRVRLSDHFLDDGVFIRSMATRGAFGGLADAVWPTAVLLDAAGFQYVIIETTGVGQTEIDVVDQADTVVVVLMPGSGDIVQMMKAGIMDVADIFVVNKADQPAAAVTVQAVRAKARHRSVPGWQVPVVATSAITLAGIKDLLITLAAHRTYLHGEAGGRAGTPDQRMAEQVVRRALGVMRGQLASALTSDVNGRRLLDEVLARKTDPTTAAHRLLAAYRCRDEGSPIQDPPAER
jgi:LAO/AO transport system kinase